MNKKHKKFNLNASSLYPNLIKKGRIMNATAIIFANFISMFLVKLIELSYTIC